MKDETTELVLSPMCPLLVFGGSNVVIVPGFALCLCCAVLPLNFGPL